MASTDRRTMARELAMQAICQMDVQGESAMGILGRFFGENAEDPEVRKLAEKWSTGVWQSMAECDALISAAAVKWELSRLNQVDRSILRLGAYQLKYCTDIPEKVVINEAIELAKKYSRFLAAFVNGVMDAILKKAKNGLTEQMRKIAMLNQKGGVGKTTSVVNIAAALAQNGKKVVVADFDPQAHLTIHLGAEPDSVQSGVYEVLTNSADFDQSLIEVRPNLFLLGANINLVGAESELVSVVGREIIFREAVSKSQHNFDFMIIDCPPSLSLLTLNALAACDEVIIPLQPHFLALQGLGKLLQTVTLVSKRINPQLKVSGVLLCMYDPRVSLSEEVKNDIDKFLENARGTDCPWSNAEVIPVLVRRNIKLAEAPSYGKTVFEYEPECNGSKDYQLIAEFMLKGSLPKQPAVVPNGYQPTPLQPIQPPIQIQAIPTSPISQPQQQLQPNQINGQ